MTDSNKKSILDFVARSNQQFASKRKVLSFDNDSNNIDSASSAKNNNNSNLNPLIITNDNNNTSATSSNTPVFLTPAQLMQQRLLAQQTGSFYSNTNNTGGFSDTASHHSAAAMSSSSSSSLISSLITGKKPSSSAPGGRQELLQTWEQKIQALISDHTQTKMECPTLLSGADRRELHLLAQKYNLSHNSVGAGTQRRLVLAKDALFYQGSSTGVNSNNNNNASSGANNDEEQKSKGQLRRERQEKRENQNEKDLYADKMAFKALQKYSAAVNPFAQAVQVSEEQEFEDNNNNNNNEGNAMMMTMMNSKFNNEDFTENNNNNNTNRRRQRNGKFNNNNDDDGDVDDDDDQAHENKNKIVAASLPDAEWTTCDQIVEAAGVNEFSECDIDWIRDFAEQCCGTDDAQNNRTQRVVFCIDFSDFVSSCSFLTRLKASATIAGESINFGLIQLSAQKKSQIESSDEEFECLKKQFDSIVARIVSLNNVNLENEICLCLPGNPLFGEALQIAVAFPLHHSNQGAVDLQKLFRGLAVDSISLI